MGENRATITKSALPSTPRGQIGAFRFECEPTGLLSCQAQNSFFSDLLPFWDFAIAPSFSMSNRFCYPASIELCSHRKEKSETALAPKEGSPTRVSSVCRGNRENTPNPLAPLSSMTWPFSPRTQRCPINMICFGCWESAENTLYPSE